MSKALRQSDKLLTRSIHYGCYAVEQLLLTRLFLFPVWQLPYFSLSVVPRVTGMIARADRGLDLEQNHENTKLVVCTSLCYNLDHEKWDV